MYLTPAIVLICRIYTYLHDNHYNLLVLLMFILTIAYIYFCFNIYMFTKEDCTPRMKQNV